jgi:hypothetical protein
MPAQRSWWTSWPFGRSTTTVPSRIQDSANRERVKLQLATSQASVDRLANEVDRLTKQIAELEVLPVGEFEIPLGLKRSFEGSVDVTLNGQYRGPIRTITGQ